MICHSKSAIGPAPQAIAENSEVGQNMGGIRRASVIMPIHEMTCLGCTDMVAGGCMRHLIWLSWIAQPVQGPLVLSSWRRWRVVPCKAEVSSIVWVPNSARTHAWALLLVGGLEKPMFLYPSNGVVGRFHLAALLHLPHLKSLISLFFCSAFNTILNPGVQICKQLVALTRYAGVKPYVSPWWSA